MFFNEIEEICELEKINPKTKLSIIEAMAKKELQIIISIGWQLNVNLLSLVTYNI